MAWCSLSPDAAGYSPQGRLQGYVKRIAAPPCATLQAECRLSNHLSSYTSEAPNDTSRALIELECVLKEMREQAVRPENERFEPSSDIEKDEQTERIRCLERANEAKKKKIQDRDRYISRLQEQYNRLKEELEKERGTSNGTEREDQTDVVSGVYVFCVDLSSGTHTKRELVEEAFQHIIRTILYRYPDTHVGVIMEHQGVIVLQDIREVNAETEHTISQCPGNGTSMVDLSITLEQALSMFSAFRSRVPKGPFRIILIGYDQIASPYPKQSIESFQSAEVEIHNLIVGKGVSVQKESLTWRIATETGGNNIFYL